MKNILLITALFLAACGDQSNSESEVSAPAEVAEVVEEKRVFIVAGQSNGLRCDWTTFSEMMNADIINIAVSGRTIEQLIELYENQPKSDGILFVHGERDSIVKTEVDKYISDVEFYRSMLDAPLYISTVGYHTAKPTTHNDLIRQAVKDHAESNDNWDVVFDSAHTFPARGMLIDAVHFTHEGCEEMQISMAIAIDDLKRPL